ncbi:MAG TPA: MoaD/ThiS family protein [Nitrososphaeraceae archaeon]
MITVSLLGGARKALGKSEISLDSYEASVNDILEFLKENATEKGIIENNNLLIVINGKDTSVMEGYDTIVRTGDVIKIVTIVHGGMF